MKSCAALLWAAALLSQHVVHSTKFEKEGGKNQSNANLIWSECRCKIVQSTSPFTPAGASDDEAPPCYEDHLPADIETFAVQYYHETECYLPGGVGGWASNLPVAKNCLTRKDSTQPAIFLLGDSHARSLKDGLEASTYKEVLPAVGYGSADLDVLRDLVSILQEEVKEGDVIWWVMRMGGAAGGPAMSAADAAYFETGANLLYNTLVQSGKAKLVLVEDWPTLGGRADVNRGEASTCHMKHKMGQFPTPCSVNYETIKLGRERALSVINTMKKKTGVFFFSAAELFCPQGLCDYNVPNRVASAYFDYGHLNPFGSRYLSPFICSFMKTRGLH